MGTMQGTRLERLDETELRLIMGFRELSPEWQQTILDTINKACEHMPPPPPNVLIFRRPVV